MKKIFKTFYYLFILAIAIIAVFLVLSAIPIKGGYKSFIVLSGSMEPKIRTGSIVATKPAENYQVGDVITFGESSKMKTPTTHRITAIEKNDDIEKYITKGDANNAKDHKQVSKNEVIGKVLFSVPFLGYAVNAAQKPIGFVLIIIVPAVIIIYDEILTIKKEILKKLDYRRRTKKRKADELENDNTKKDDVKEEKEI
ncbi:signal peptidase I [bacterium]|jgi:signal peptidase I|nr:signal peptidase I [bacterium]MBT4251106.1 signal peptidase I [bacterium]MBT4598102.1 signal peptidase I [bacterium]MBT6753444.1 signal peptidase I [bacterium]MBT7038157.1 signal peptidase I [bacterium]